MTPIASLLLAQTLTADTLDVEVAAEFATTTAYEVAESFITPLGDDTLVAALGRYPESGSLLVNNDYRLLVQRLAADGTVVWSTGQSVKAPTSLARGFALQEAEGRVSVVTGYEMGQLWTFDLPTGDLLGFATLPVTGGFLPGELRFDPVNADLIIAGSESFSNEGRFVVSVPLDLSGLNWKFDDIPDILQAISSEEGSIHLSPDASACYWTGVTDIESEPRRFTAIKLDLATGTLIWSNSNPAAERSSSALSPSGDRLAYAIETGFGPRYGQIDTATSQVQWQHNTMQDDYDNLPMVAYSQDGNKVAVGFGRSLPNLGALALGADAADGLADWVVTRDTGYSPNFTFLEASNSQLSGTSDGDWIWAYGSSVGAQSTSSAVAIERLGGIGGTSQGVDTLSLHGSDETHLIELAGVDSQGRSRLLYEGFVDSPWNWNLGRLAMVNPLESGPSWQHDVVPEGPDQSRFMDIAEVPGTSRVVGIVQGAASVIGVVTQKGLCVCFDVDSGDLLWSRPVHAEVLAVSPDGTRVAVRGVDRRLYVLDTSDGAELHVIDPQIAPAAIRSKLLGDDDGAQTMLFEDDLLVYQETGTEDYLRVFDLQADQERFSLPMGDQDGTPMSIEGDRLYYMSGTQSGQRYLRWASLTTGQVGAESAAITDVNKGIFRLLARPDHVLMSIDGAGAPDELRRYSSDLSSFEVILSKSMSAPISYSLHRLAPGLGVMTTYGTNNSNRAVQVDVPQPGGGYQNVGWTVESHQSPFISAPSYFPTDGGRTIVDLGLADFGELPSSFKPSVYDAETGTLLGASEVSPLPEFNLGTVVSVSVIANRLIAGAELAKTFVSFQDKPGSLRAAILVAELPTLYRSADEVSLGAPSPVDFYLRGPLGSAGAGVHFLLAGLGTASPPTVVDGFEVPFSVMDPVTACVLLQCEPTIFEGFAGVWEADGLSQARLNTPPGLETLAGLTLDLAWLGFDANIGPGLQVLSSTVSVELTP